LQVAGFKLQVSGFRFQVEGLIPVTFNPQSSTRNL